MEKIGIRLHKNKLVLVNLYDDKNNDGIIMTIGHKDTKYSKEELNILVTKILNKYNL